MTLILHQTKFETIPLKVAGDTFLDEANGSGQILGFFCSKFSPIATVREFKIF